MVVDTDVTRVFTNSKAKVGIMEVWASQLFNGLSLSLILLLTALGLALSFGLMNVINLAHGEFIMVGAYTTYALQQVATHYTGDPQAGVTFLIAIPASFLTAAAAGYVVEATLIRFLYRRPLDTLLATWGVGLFLQQMARSIFGAPNVQVVAPSWLGSAVTITSGLLLPVKRIFIIGLVLTCLGGLYWYMYRSNEGRRMRGVMQNREMAASLGVSTRRVDSFTFALGSGLAGIAGCALTLIGPIGPSPGNLLHRRRLHSRHPWWPGTDSRDHHGGPNHRCAKHRLQVWYHGGGGQGAGLRHSHPLPAMEAGRPDAGSGQVRQLWQPSCPSQTRSGP